MVPAASPSTLLTKPLEVSTSTLGSGSGAGGSAGRLVLVHFSTLLLPVSAAQRLPEESKARLFDPESWPASLPVVPNCLRKIPSVENSEILLLLESATQRLLSVSAAIPAGAASWPSSAPAIPKL